MEFPSFIPSEHWDAIPLINDCPVYPKMKIATFLSEMFTFSYPKYTAYNGNIIRIIFLKFAMENSWQLPPSFNFLALSGNMLKSYMAGEEVPGITLGIPLNLRIGVLSLYNTGHFIGMRFRTESLEDLYDFLKSPVVCASLFEPKMLSNVGPTGEAFFTVQPQKKQLSSQVVISDSNGTAKSKVILLPPSESSNRRGFRSPDQRESRSPARRRSRSPNRQRSRSSNRRRSRSPNRRRSRSPNRRRSRSPNKRRSRSPNRQRSRSPNRRRSHSPARMRSRSPNRQRSRSLNRRRSRSDHDEILFTESESEHISSSSGETKLAGQRDQTTS